MPFDKLQREKQISRKKNDAYCYTLYSDIKISGSVVLYVKRVNTARLRHHKPGVLRSPSPIRRFQEGNNKSKPRKYSCLTLQ